MDCPHCGFHFGVLAANAAEIPVLAPIVCEHCAEVSLLVDGRIREMTPEELAYVVESPAWGFIETARRCIRDANDLLMKRPPS